MLCHPMGGHLLGMSCTAQKHQAPLHVHAALLCTHRTAVHPALDSQLVQHPCRAGCLVVVVCVGLCGCVVRMHLHTCGRRGDVGVLPVPVSIVLSCGWVFAVRSSWAGLCCCVTGV